MVNYDQSGMSLPSLLSLTKVLTLIGCEQELGIDKTTLIIPASSLPTPLTTMRTPVSRTSTADPRTDSARTHTLPASNLRDLGTHLCALPTGEHCPKGLICLGCAHVQPKKSAVPVFRRMLASHERGLVAARGHREPAGQIAAREMEMVRIKGALQRAEELSDDVAAAIERAS